MEREIVFRGKRIDTGEWVEGYYAKQSNHACFAHELKYTHFIYQDVFMDFGLGGLSEFEVNPKTVGQYTGLTDKNGTKIFEGDIVTYEDAEADYEGYHDNVFLNCGEVEISAWDGICFTNRQTVEMSDLYENETMVDCEVIGNIYDNPKLLRSEEE